MRRLQPSALNQRFPGEVVREYRRLAKGGPAFGDLD
jgi:hypothetical protein